MTACKSLDGKILSLRVVNLDRWNAPTEIDLMHYTPSGRQAQVIQIKGNLEDTNTHRNPNKIVPVESTIPMQRENERIKYTFPAYSYTIINFK